MRIRVSFSDKMRRWEISYKLVNKNDWRTDWQTGWRTDWRTDWRTGEPIYKCLIEWLTDKLTDRLTDRRTNLQVPYGHKNRYNQGKHACKYKKFERKFAWLRKKKIMEWKTPLMQRLSERYYDGQKKTSDNQKKWRRTRDELRWDSKHTVFKSVMCAYDDKYTLFPYKKHFDDL